MNTSLVVSRYNENLSWLKNVKLNKVIYNKCREKSISFDDIKNSSEDITIISLNNIGRETHSLLKHIVLNYSSLPDITIFLQGYPFDHLGNLERLFPNEKLEDVLNKFSSEEVSGKFVESITGLGNYHSDAAFELQVKDIYNELGINKLKFTTDNTTNLPWFPLNGTNLMKNVYSIGCQYILPKNYILNKPIDFYEKMLDWHENPNNKFILSKIKNSRWYRWSNASEMAPIAPGETTCLGYCLERTFLNIFSHN